MKSTIKTIRVQNKTCKNKKYYKYVLMKRRILKKQNGTNKQYLQINGFNERQKLI
jgi:hypothetical protein